MDRQSSTRQREGQVLSRRNHLQGRGRGGCGRGGGSGADGRYHVSGLGCGAGDDR